MNSGQNGSYFPALTGIRAIAAYLVFIHHYNPFYVKYFGTAVHYFFSEMHIGVTMFFVLSGLLLCLRYYDNFSHDFTSFYNYMVKRFAKIYPVYFLVLTLNFIYCLNTGFFATTPYQNGWIYYLGGLTFLKGFFAGAATTFVGQAWSLTVEECFYLFCPLFFLLIRKNDRSIFLLPIFLLLFGVLLVLAFSQGEFFGFFQNFRFLFNFTFFGRCIEFFIGIGLALAFKRLPAGRKMNAKGMFTYLGIANIIVCTWLISRFHTPANYGDYHPIGILINNVILPLVGISVLYWGLLTEQTFISKILTTPLFSLLGKASYTFYLVHLGVFSSLLTRFVSTNVVVIFIGLNLIAVFLYKAFEHPLNGWIKKNFIKPIPALKS
jgi:peptidoglycan/LPS O-acetylase OafA/YrhL